ncbi:MAG TPA: hypothetical protein VJ794_07630, partial [Gemmatimonadales bacterium]|nr:hypothetical protein [Gemmatimonadales bacterium]
MIGPLATAALLAAPAGHGAGAVTEVLLGLAFVLVGAKLAGALAEWLGQPSVLGELMVGVALGNLALLGGPDVTGIGEREAFIVL